MNKRVNENKEYENSDTVRIPVTDYERKTVPVICPWCNRLYKLLESPVF